MIDKVIEDELVTAKAIQKIGKAAGIIESDDSIAYVVHPNANYINTAESLDEADVILDGAIKNASDQIAGKIDNINVNGTDGTVNNGVASVSISGDSMNVGQYTPITYPDILSGSPTVASSDNINQAFSDVETAISDLADYVMNHVDEYTPSTSATYISSATSLQNADDILDEALAELSGKSIENINVNGVSGTVEDNIASVSVDGHDILVGEYSATTYPTEIVNAESIDESDTLSESLEKVEHTINALAQEVIKNEKVEANAIEAICEASGILDEDNSITYVVNTNANYINTANSLANADDILDAAIKNVSNDVNDIDSNYISGVSVNGIDATIENKKAIVTISGSDENVGEYTSVTYPEELSGAVNVSGSQTISEAFNAVETTVSSLTQEVLTNEEVTQKAVSAVGKAAGTIDENDVITYVVNNDANYINTAVSLADADDILDAAIADLSGKSIENISVNGTNGTVNNGVASVSISGDSMNVGQYTPITYPAILSGSPTVASSDNVNQAFSDVETTISNLADYVMNHVDEYTPSTSATYISSATSLQNADDILDEALAELSGKSIENINVNGVSGTVEDNIASLTVDGNDIQVGEYSAVTYVEGFSGATPVESGDTVSQAINSVENTLASLVQEVIDDEQVTSKGITKIATAAGILQSDDSINYVVNGNAHYINTATSLADADNILDAALHDLVSRIEAIENQLIALDARITDLEQ